MNPIVAVVVTYNRKDLLLQCIEHLKNQCIERGYDTGKPCEWHDQFDILVVDNASTDGTEEALADLVNQNDIIYMNTGANLGGAGGFNFGMRLAVEKGYRYCWVMDDDCLAEPAALQALIDADYGFEGDYGYLSSVVRWVDGSPCAMNIQRHPLTHNIDDFTCDFQPCTLASFVSLFLPTAVIAEVGLPIADFFVWSDDWEFTRRISRRYDCFVVGKSVVTHASKTNNPGTIVDDVPERLDRYRLIYRNDIVMYREEGALGWAFVCSRGLSHIAKVLLRSPELRLKKIGIILSSNMAGLRYRPAIEYPQFPSPEKKQMSGFLNEKIAGAK